MRLTSLALLTAASLATGSCASCASMPPFEDAGPAESGEPNMAALTFTANATTNNLTIVGHGLNTGDGPAATRNVGGALPGGLAPVTDYFVIRVDADTLKLATSSTNAFAGTAIDITDNGTGTNILEIGVPYRRPRTYAPGVQLASADLNANFDTWSAAYALLTGQPQSIWDGVTIDGDLHVSGDISHGITTLIIPIESPTTTAAALFVPFTTRFRSQIPLAIGDRVRTIRAKVRDSATGPTTLAVALRVVDTIAFSNATVGTGTASLGTGNIQDIQSLPMTTGAVSGTRYYAEIRAITGAAACEVFDIQVDVDRPAS